MNELSLKNNAIQVQNITFHYDREKHHGVGPINFEIPAGSIVGLLGPNGAGKSTTVGLICCLLYPQQGTARVNGFDILTERQKVRQQIGLMTQGRSLEWRLTIEENIEFYLRLHGVPRKERESLVCNALEEFGLVDVRNHRAIDVSGGQSRRAQLARVLSGPCSIIILDEPTIGFDPVAQEMVWQKIINLPSEGKTILITTNDMREAQRTCDEVFFLNRGEIVGHGTPSELRRAVNRKVVEIEINGDAHLAKSLLENTFSEVNQDKQTLRVIIEDFLEVRSVLDCLDSEILEIVDFSLSQPELHDIFNSMFGRG